MAKILVTGASGFLGSVLAARAAAAGHMVAGTWLNHPFTLEGVHAWRADLADPRACSALVSQFRPDWIFHLAAQSRPDLCARDAAACRLQNIDSARHLAQACSRTGAWMVLASSDLVYSAPAPDEAAPALPAGLYGFTKLAAEQAMAQALPGACTALRLALLYGTGLARGTSFAEGWAARLAGGEPMDAFTDQVRCPIHARDAADAFLRAAETRAAGVIHAAGPEAISRHAFALELCAAYGFDPGLVRPALAADARFDDPRPLDLTLGPGRLPDLLGRPAMAPREGLRLMAHGE